MTREIWIIIALIALAGSMVFAALATSLRDLSKPILEEIATIRKKPGASRRVARILDDVDGHTVAVGFPRIVCNLVFVVALVNWIKDVRTGGGEGAFIGWVELSIGVAAASILLWIFGTLIPIAVARHAGEAMVYAWSWLVRGSYAFTTPIRPLMRLVDEVIRRLSGKDKGHEQAAIQQELLSVVEEATEEGAVDETERDMIEAVVRFRDRTVAQVMTPRTQIEAMALSNDLSKVTGTIRTIGHSRIPVYEGDLDHVVGIFYVKDLMKWLAGEGGSRSGTRFDLRSLLRPALFVPETKTIRELLPELLAKRVHIAMVADEYGGTAGLVTIEDIVEEVFGDIQDEYEQPEEGNPEVKLDETARTAELDARASIEDVNYELKRLGAQIPAGEDYETVGGFVTVSMGRIPVPGETLEFEGGLLTVLAAEPTRVTRVLLTMSQATLDAPTSGTSPGTEPERDEPHEPELARGAAGGS